MLERDDFQKRLARQQPISMHEIFYPLIQGYDSVALRADVELGGTDQKFNLLVGRDLQRDYGMAPQVVLTMPLLEGTDGVNKMSKSLGNAIGITENPRDMFGKVMSISDAMMWRYFELLSDMLAAEIVATRRRAETGGVNPRDAKVLLAAELVARFHSPDASRQAVDEFDRVFREKRLPDNVPVVKSWGAGALWICKVMTQHALAESTSQARRLIEQGAVTVNGGKVEDVDMQLAGATDYLLKVGKKKFLKIEA
jgi:tyrosyl-tRNA synthetase